MTYYADEWDRLSQDVHETLAHVSVVIAGKASLGTLDPATGLRSGATTVTTAAIPALRGKLQTTRRDDGSRVEYGRWVVRYEDVVDVGVGAVGQFKPPVRGGTLAESDRARDGSYATGTEAEGTQAGATYTITKVEEEVGAREWAVYAYRTV